MSVKAHDSDQDFLYAFLTDPQNTQLDSAASGERSDELTLHALPPHYNVDAGSLDSTAFPARYRAAFRPGLVRIVHFTNSKPWRSSSKKERGHMFPRELPATTILTSYQRAWAFACARAFCRRGRFRRLLAADKRELSPAAAVFKARLVEVMETLWRRFDVVLNNLQEGCQLPLCLVPSCLSAQLPRAHRMHNK